MKKQKIEEMFSSLENFSKIPPADLWDGIEEKLEQPQKKKRGFFWWSVAASLLIGLGLFSTFYFQSNQEIKSGKVPVSNENGVVLQKSTLDTLQKERINNVIVSPESVIEVTIPKSPKDSRIAKREISELKKINKENDSKSAQKQPVLKGIKEGVANTNQTINNTATESLLNEKKGIKSSVNEKILKYNEQLLSQKKTVEEIKNNSDKTTEDTKLKDKTVVKPTTENALAAIEKEQQKEKQIPLTEKWSLQVFAGIGNSQNLKKQKSLGNTIESTQSNSYGVKTNYKLNNRWAISSGIKISELGQEIANVSYINQANNLVQITGVSLVQNQTNTAISNNTDYLFITNKEQKGVSSTFSQTGDLTQRLQYFEMPLEISYAILNKGKTNIKMNTGGFMGKLISNEMLLNGNSIGESKEANNIIFGSILSSTLQYQFYKKTHVFVEPGMNYYAKPIQNQNFNQFQLLINFGLNVTF